MKGGDTSRRIFEGLIGDIKHIIESDKNRDEKLKEICKLLREKVPHYNWVGFYLVDTPRELVLGPYVGEPTRHTRIPFGRGVCGKAAEDRKTIIVQDVSKEVNYLACSLKVKSEIIVPIFKGSKLVGEIDIDSHSLFPFKEEDKMFLETLSKLISNIF